MLHKGYDIIRVSVLLKIYLSLNNNNNNNKTDARMNFSFVDY